MTWSEVPRPGAVAPEWVRARNAAEWQPFLTDHTFVLRLDWAQILRAAVADDTQPVLQRHFLEGLVLGRWFFEPHDPVLGHLLGRLYRHLSETPRTRVAQIGTPVAPWDERERALLQTHVLDLLEQRPGLVVRWATQLRAGFQKLAPRALQLTPPGATMTLDPARVGHDGYFTHCRPPAMVPANPRPDLARDEARWLLACNSWRDGARRIGDTVVVNLASYALVAQLLERETFLTRERAYPEAGATRADWYAVGDRWASCLRNTLDGAWATHRDPYDLAASVEWEIPREAPLVALSAAALTRTAQLKTPSRRLRYTPGVRRGGPRYIELSYGETTVTVTRFVIPKIGERFFFEAPYEVPEDYLAQSRKPTARHRTRLAGRVQWSLDALDWQSRELDAQGFAVYPQAADYSQWAREQWVSLSHGGYASQLRTNTRQSRRAAWETGQAKTLGPFVVEEDVVISLYMDNRAQGPLQDSEYEVLVARLPGRTVPGIKRRIKALSLRRAREMGWSAFRRSGWWPGKNEARSLYQLSRKG